MPSNSLASGCPELSHGRTIAICPLVVTNGVVSTISRNSPGLRVVPASWNHSSVGRFAGPFTVTSYPFVTDSQWPAIAIPLEIVHGVSILLSTIHFPLAVAGLPLNPFGTV